MKFDYAIIDADSPIYAIAFTTKSPALAKKAFDKYIQEVMDDGEVTQAHVLVKGEDNFRFLADPNYKGQRVAAIPEDVRERVDRLYEYVYTWATRCHGGEADDYASILAHQADANGDSVFVSHIDKDLNQIPGWHYNHKTKEFYEVSSESGYRFLMQQCITGDSTDNIFGIKNIGPVKGGRLVDAPCNTILQVCLNKWEELGGENWKDNFVRCANGVYLRKYEDDMRPLNFDELKDKLKWTTDIGSTSQTDQMTPSDSSTPSSGQPEDNTSEENNS